MSNGTQEAKVSTASALDKILSQVHDNNSRLQDILSNVQAFTARTLGEDMPPGPASDTPQPQGMLGNIDAALSTQTILISGIQDAVRVLERIG